MKSVAVAFTGPRQADSVELDDPEDGEYTTWSLATLMSPGTEMTYYRRDVELGGHWGQWVQYPVYPEYSCVG